MISVVMSVYNGGEYLAEAIESVLNQTYRDFEFIIVNDGSADQSLEVIKIYQEQDDRIVLISRENRGLIVSLNEGLEKAKGKYIARMDADDICLPTRFEEQIEFMEQNPDIGICGSWIEIFGENFKTKIIKAAPLDEKLRVQLIFSVPVMHPSVIIRKDLLDKYNLRYNEEYKTAEDYKMWIDCAKFTRFANIQRVLLKYRILDTSITRIAEADKDDKRYEVMNRIFKEALEEMRIQNSEKENRFHFALQSHNRIAKTDIDLSYLDSYIEKLLKANKYSKVFHHGYLEQLLFKKFLVVVYFKIKNRDFSFLQAPLYKRFWLATWSFLVKQI